MTELLVAPCDAKAAKYAVMNFHYSKKMPLGKLIKYGVWENNNFLGAVIYGRGTGTYLGQPYGLDMIEVCELVRVALREHKSPVTQILSKTIKLLRQENQGLRLIVSFADPNFGHTGIIYQAGGWIFAGLSPVQTEYFYKGKWFHSRNLGRLGFGGFPEIARLSKEEKKLLPTRKQKGKYRYLYPLDRTMRKQIEKLRQPYPRAVEGLEVSRDASGVEGQVRSLPTALKI